MDTPGRIGRFDVVEKLGEGGMGILYLARDSTLGRPVAIKILSVVNAELRERFSREARSSARLKHHNIVTIYDIGEDNGRPYIAMEYVDGETLAELIRRRKPVPLARKLELMQELCAGLGYAHRAGVIHRDIKPANVMITADGVLKVLDFGVARLVSEGSAAGLTVAGALIGTPHYMSPEQIEGQPTDHRADIFGVGILFYELITYRKAYPGDGWQSVFQKILHSVPQPLRELSEDIDPEIERIVGLCIARDPAARYADLSLMAADLRRVLERVRANTNESTVRIDRSQLDVDAAAGRGSRPAPRTPPSNPARGPNPEAMARRRAERVRNYLEKAAEDLRAGDLESAADQCEMAILLDPAAPQALELLDEVNRAFEDRQLLGWLNEAEDHLSKNALTAAASLIDDALQLRPQSPRALQLQRTVNNRRFEQERRAERARAARSAIERGRAGLHGETYEAAIRSANEALAYEPDNADAQELKRQATALLEEQRQRQREQLVNDVTEDARRLAGSFHFEPAIRLLATIPFVHPSVERLKRELLVESEKYEARIRAEAEAKRLAEEAAQRRAAEEAQRRAEEEARRKAEAEARRRAEEAEIRRRAEEVAKRQAEAEARRRAEIEALRRAEQEAKQKADAAARRLAEEAAMRKAAAEARRREEAEAKRKADAEARRAAAEEARQKAEAEVRRREEEEAKRKADAEARRVAAEEARRKAEAEVRRREEEEAKRKADAEARRVAAEEARRVAAEEARRKAEAEARRLEEIRAKRKADEDARRLAEEEAKRQAAAEAKRLAEEEARRQAEAESRRRAEEESRRLAEEENRRQAEAAAKQQAEEQAKREAEEQAKQRAEAEARRRELEEARRQAKAEYQRRVEEARLAAAAERQRQAELEARLKAEADARRREEEEAQRKAEAEAQRLREEETRQRLEAEARRAAEEEETRRAQAEAQRRADEERRRHEAAQRAAGRVALQARRLFVKGQPDEAIRLLEAFEPRALVEAVIAEITYEWKKLDHPEEVEPVRESTVAPSVGDAPPGDHANISFRENTPIDPGPEPELELFSVPAPVDDQHSTVPSAATTIVPSSIRGLDHATMQRIWIAIAAMLVLILAIAILRWAR